MDRTPRTDALVQKLDKELRSSLPMQEPVEQYDELCRSLEAEIAETVDALASLARIVEAFGYTTQLGKSQRVRLDNACALLARIKG